MVSNNLEELGNFIVIPVAYITSSPTLDYKLQNRFILNSSATTYVCNDQFRFQNFQLSVHEWLYTGNTIVPIEGFSSMEITLQGPKGPRKAWLTKVALVSSFHTSIASLKCFIQKDVHWNTQAEELTYQGKMYCKVPQRHGQWVLEYHPLEAAFPIRSTDPCLDSKVSMDLWH